MTASVVKKDGDIVPRLWGGGSDEKGWTTYNAQWLVQCTDVKDGIDVVLHATDLPSVGDPWVFGNDSRTDVVRQPGQQGKVYRNKENTSGYYWTVDQVFSNKASVIGGRPVISIGGQKYTKEVFRDRFGKAILTSAFEPVRGPQVEFDFNRTQVRIEQSLTKTVVVNNLPTWFRLANAGMVNAATMWGVPPRCVKVEPFQVEEKFDEDQNLYFTVTFEFSIYVDQDSDGNPISGFDRFVLNEGTKARGTWKYPTGDIADAEWTTEGWGPVNKPTSYDRYYDKRGNIARVVIEPKTGKPWTGGDLTDPPRFFMEHYPEDDIATLMGVPNPLYG